MSFWFLLKTSFFNSILTIFYTYNIFSLKILDPKEKEPSGTKFLKNLITEIVRSGSFIMPTPTGAREAPGLVLLSWSLLQARCSHSYL